MIETIGDDPKRSGLRDTPTRVVQSWSHMYGGYKINVDQLFRTFDEEHDQMVILRDIDFTSMCEHHMLPFLGRAHVGYLPQGKRVVGISKLVRVVDAYARRLQVQERLTNQVARAIVRNLKPLGAGCVIEAQHLCMVCRGVQKQNTVMVTSALFGEFRDDPAVRSEFLRLVGK
jgi:GTP cyclohydrolase IA